MTADNDDFDNDDAQSKETADDIATRTVSDFYATWKPETAADSKAPQVPQGRRDPRSYLYTKDLVAEPTDVTNILRRALPAVLTSPAPSGDQEPSITRPVSDSRFSKELMERRQEVSELAEKLLGSREAARRWFATSFRHWLMGRRPIDLMESIDGCDEVQRFLMDLYPPTDT